MCEDIHGLKVEKGQFVTFPESGIYSSSLSLETGRVELVEKNYVKVSYVDPVYPESLKTKNVYTFTRVSSAIVEERMKDKFAKYSSFKLPKNN